MKVVVVGAGISGLSAAYYLTRRGHEVTVLESGERIGGHTATIDVETSQGTKGIDTGFIVFNDWTYPNFIALLNELDVEYIPTTMGFSVSCEQSGLEYAGGSLNMLFAQRSNLLRPRFLRMVADILRFNREAIADLASGRLDQATSLGEYLQANKYSGYFIDKYLVPMGAAIWSSGVRGMRDFPVAFFVEFFKNHGLLSVSDRPQWHVIKGGSNAYIEPLTRPFSDDIFTSVKMKTITRDDAGVAIKMSAKSDGKPVEMESQYDAMIVATHSNQALELPMEVHSLEKEILGSIPYQSNDVVLHTDTSLLPSLQRTWSSWNYRINDKYGSDEAHVTYNMNILQRLELPETYCVSLNQSDAISEDKIIGEYQYSHPVFTAAGEKAKQRWGEIAGVHRTWYSGAYWYNGFHEDGVRSALRAAEAVHQAAV